MAFSPSPKKPLSPKEKELLALLARNTMTTHSQASQALGVSMPYINRLLRRLNYRQLIDYTPHKQGANRSLRVTEEGLKVIAPSDCPPSNKSDDDAGD